ncbi:MAG: hypothetical protein LBI45_00010 [Bacteroidales bacterium]|jgi:hypothetical protein|nr:hypothetical protein [Bacteroidales bacterium]
MNKLLVFFTGMMLFLFIQQVPVQAQPQDPFALHYWLNPMGVNYTLSAPSTTNGEWIAAAPRNERLSPVGVVPIVYASRKNTVAVFRMSNAGYTLLPNPDDVKVFGVNAGGIFNQEVDFEVHCVVQSCNRDTNYILCGAISLSEDHNPVGMVAVLDTRLELVNLRYYEAVKTFYSVYAQDGFYFVCGQMQDSTAIVLRDSIPSRILQNNITAFYTRNQPNWAFHKIAVRKAPGYQLPCSFEFSVSGARETGDSPQIGWAVFQMNLGFFTFSNAAYSFTPNHGLNSRVTIANYPSNAPLSTTQGLLLSASDGNKIFTYVFNDNQQQVMNGAFRIPNWYGVLTDMARGGNEVAWVGNRGTTPTSQRADYIRTNIPYPYPSSPPTYVPPTAQYIIFTPVNQPPAAYYALHKVHYNDGDGRFHAGGYYNGRDENGNCNRAVFAVTPEQVWEDNRCTERKEINFENEAVRQLEPIAVARVYIQANMLPKLTKTYGFCTMECEKKWDSDCGNIKKDERKK